MTHFFFSTRCWWLPVFCVALFALSTFMTAVPAAGQSADDLQQLLTRQLLQMQRGTTSAPNTIPSALDTARERAASNRRAPVVESLDMGSLGVGGGDSAESRLRLRLLAEQRKPSRLEADMSQRSGQELTQFGYDLFAVPAPLEGVFSGAVQEDYVLGIGDELVITFRGQTSETQIAHVDREGQVVLPVLPPIAAAGRTFGDFRRDLQARTEMTLLGTDVYVSVGAIRTVPVIVVGEVKRPGFQYLPALSTFLDALSLAGGIKKTGSLRRIQVVRGRTIIPLDLYDLLLTGTLRRDLAIAEGDRIVVPPVGPTVGVAGWVKRPAIYELGEDRDGVSLADLVRFGGGTVRPSGVRFLHIRPDRLGREQVLEQTDLQSIPAHDGDILLANLSQDIQVGDVLITGHMRVEDRRSLAMSPTLRDLIRHQSALELDPYLLFAAVETTDERTRSRRFYPVNIEKVLAGEENFALQDRDTVIVLGSNDIRYLSSKSVQTVLGGGELEELVLSRCRGLRSLTEIIESGRSGRFGAAILQAAVRLASEKRKQNFERVDEETAVILRQLELDERRVKLAERRARFEELKARAAADPLNQDILEKGLSDAGTPSCPAIFDEFEDLLPFVLEYAIALNGEVRIPGAYPIVPGTSLSSVVAVAGGLTREVDLTKLEVTRFNVDSVKGQALTERQTYDVGRSGLASVTISPGDVVRLNPVFNDRDAGPVELVGEFKRPGLYAIRRGERLSEVIARAGGLTAQSYPLGAIFTRDSVRKTEREGIDRAARELEASLATAITSPQASSRNLAGAASAVERLVATLREVEPVGRVVVEADPTVLQVRPDLDLVLEPGDKVFMPKRPNSVTVAGEVLNPGALQFQPGFRPDRYVDMAGGLRRGADESRIFVVLPNGAAQPISISFWNYEPIQIPPGSTIVVPRDPAPFDFMTFAKETTELLSRVALIAASLAVISDN